MHLSRTTAKLLIWVWVLALAPAMGCRAEEAASPQQQFRAFIMEGRKPAELKPKLLDSSVRDGKRVERVSFETEVGEKAIAVVMRPDAGTERLPAIVVQHWLGGTKDEVLIQLLLQQFAARGYLAVAIDGRYRGERATKSLDQATLDTLHSGKGRSWIIDTVYDITRTLDYLLSRPDVDPARIGMTGISEGGVETWMTSVVDPRIAVAVPVIGVTRFSAVLSEVASGNGQGFIKLFHKVLDDQAQAMGEPAVNERVVRATWEKLMPGSLDKFDPVRLLPTVAPRPLLMLNHEKDEIMPLKGAEEVYQACQARYRELKAEDHVQLRVAPGLPHAGQDMTEIAALFGWFDQWLKKPAAAP